MLLIALCCLFATACQRSVDSSVTLPDEAASSQIYAEKPFDLAGLHNMQEFRSLADGTLMCIGSSQHTAGESIFHFDGDGSIINIIELANDNSRPLAWRRYCIDAEGGVYVYEKYMSPVAAPEASEASEQSDQDNLNGIQPAPAYGAPSADDAPPQLRRLDADGQEISGITLITPDEQHRTVEDINSDMPSNISVDVSAGLIYEGKRTQLNIFDLNTGELKETIPNDEGEIRVFAVMKDGYICDYNYDQDGVTLRCFNPITGAEKWSKRGMSFSDLAYCAVDDKLYGRTGRKVISFDDNGQDNTLLELTDFSVMSPFAQINSLVVGINETVYCLLTEQQTNQEQRISEREKELDEIEASLEENPDMPLDSLFSRIMPNAMMSDQMKGVLIAQTGAADIPPAKEITVSIMFENPTLTTMSSAFHAANPNIRVKFREMIPQDEFLRQDVDYNQLIQRVNTEIISGNAADVLMLSDLPFESYGEKNILEDIIPFMENDPEFNIDDYRQNVLDAFKQDGKLYALPTGFSVPVFVSAKDVFTQEELTATDYFDKLFALNPNELNMQYTREASDLFSKLMISNIDYFTDEAGNIQLDTSEFIAFLESIKQADGVFRQMPPLDENQGFRSFMMMKSYTTMPVPIFTETGLVMDLDDMHGYIDATGFKQQFGKDFELRFLPGFHSSNTKGFISQSIFGINSSSEKKDAAWQFLKFIISEPMQMQTAGAVNTGFPINKKAGEKLVNIHLRAANLVLREHALEQLLFKSDPYSSMPDHRIYIENQFSQHDADALESIISRVDTLLNYDTTVSDIAREELQPFLKGQKNAGETAKTLQSRLSAPHRNCRTQRMAGTMKA